MSTPKNTRFIDEFVNDSNDSPDSSENDANSNQKTSPAGETSEKEDFAKLLGESFKNQSRKLSVGDKIRGKILILGKEDVYVSTGTSIDGVISRRELLEPDGTCTFKTDDVIELYVSQVRRDEIRLARKSADRGAAEDLEDAFDMMLPIQGRIVEVCKGGVRVNIKGKLAFCPISQIDINHVESPELFVGKSFDFRITEFKENGRNIVVSRRKLLQEERELNSGSFLEENKDGAIVQGKVARLEKFGAFVELSPGVDGLVHISEIAWSRIGDPSEVLQVGQEVTVKLLKRETVGDRVKISLSIKQAIPRDTTRTEGATESSSAAGAATANDPWSKLSVGQVITGKINRKELYGLFIELEPGITGLLHQSKMSEHPEIRFEKLRVNDPLTVQIGELRKAERRISLDLPGDPHEHDWKEHKQAAVSFGTFGGALGDQLKAAMAKKKK